MYVFLSPHYDDAVYSCGGTIYKLTQHGETVLIITIMGGDPPASLPDTPIVRDLHQRWEAGDNPIAERRQEDQHAAARLGASVEHWDIPDCVYRTDQNNTPLYPTEETLWHNTHPADSAVTQLTVKQVSWDADAMIYAPLGVGGHVDHLVVRDWALAAFGAVTLYPEYPYTEQVGAVEGAIVALDGCVVQQPNAVLLTEQDIAAKIEGVKAYRSQISTFWQNESVLAARVRASLLRGSNQFAEHYYQTTRKS